MMHFLFAVPRLVFLTSPLAYLLLGQNIIAASPLAIVAYALPHMYHSIATNARVQSRWRHSFWSEIYETVLALFLVRVTLVTLLNPRRGKFNVTDKGGILNNGYFDMRAVYPNLILAATLAAGLARGVFGMFLQQTTRLQFQALLLNSIWVTFSLLIVLAALAVGRETRQVRGRARIPARLPCIVWLPDGRALRGVSQNISLGGARIEVLQPDGVRTKAPLELELQLGSERLVLPAQLVGWDDGLLRTRWQPRDISDESDVVRLLFGRADAWVDWNRFPIDRPLASLWCVLVSIRGLFRPRGQPIMVPAAATQVPQQASTATTLARQSLVLRPRNAVAARARSVPAATVGVLMAALLCGKAEAASPGAAPPAAAPALAPTAPSQDNVPLPPPSARPVVPAPPSTAAAPRPGIPAAPMDTTAVSRVIVLTMHDLGAKEPMTMRGSSTIQGLLFGIRNDEVVTDARLSLSGAMSPSLIADLSNVTVTLNEQYVGTIPVNHDRPEFGPLAMTVNPVFFQDRNRLNFRFSGRYTQDCNDPLSGLLWATISDTSTLTLTVVRLPPQRDLARLPLPFFDANVRRKQPLPFIVASDASNETLRAAATVASWLGKLADYRGVSFPVGGEPPQEGNAVLVAVGSEATQSMSLPPLNGPTIADIANPNDPLGTILVVAGRTGAEVMQAADLLAVGANTLSGDRATVRPPVIPARKPYDAPAWMPTDRPVRFGELVDVSALQGVGYVPGTFHVPFRVPPDLYTWRRRPFQADIQFRAPPGPIIDVAMSMLNVSINGMYLRSYSLAPADRQLDWVLRQLGFARPIRYASTPVPTYAVFGQNDLQLFFDARPLHSGDCHAIPEDLHLGVDPDSTLDLSNAYHFTTLPNLAFFTNSGFPFTRLADLSETAVVLPHRPSQVELSAFLNLMGLIGSLTFQPVTRLTIVRPENLPQVADKDLLVVSTIAHLDAAADLLSLAPYRIEGGALHVALPTALTDIWHLFGDSTGSDRRQIATVLNAPLDNDAAALIGAQSPLARARSVVALVSASPQGLEAMVDAIRDPRLVPNIQGDLALLAGGTVTSYRAGGTYTIGSLPFWIYPEWLLEDQPIAIIVTILLATGMLAMSLYRVLRWRAGRRVVRSRAVRE